MGLRTIVFSMGLLSAAAVEAGTLSCGGAPCQGSYAGAAYSAAKCPAAPEMPAVRTGSAAAYNASVQKANAYSAAAKAHLDCMAAEANADQKDIGTALRDSLKHEQDAAQANLDTLKEALKNAPKTPSGGPSSAPPAVSTRY